MVSSKDLNQPQIHAVQCPSTVFRLSILASFPGVEEGRRKSAWYTLFAHSRNYSKGCVAELGVCTNMTINGSCE